MNWYLFAQINCDFVQFLIQDYRWVRDAPENWAKMHWELVTSTPLVDSNWIEKLPAACRLHFLLEESGKSRERVYLKVPFGDFHWHPFPISVASPVPLSLGPLQLSLDVSSWLPLPGASTFTSIWWYLLDIGWNSISCLSLVLLSVLKCFIRLNVV